MAPLKERLLEKLLLRLEDEPASVAFAELRQF